MSVQAFDISNVLPQGIEFKIEDNSYEIIYNYRAIKRLADIYGTVDKAMDALGNEDKYTTTLNFLYAALTDKYKLKKEDIEKWLGINSIKTFYEIVFSAILLSYGKQENMEEAEDSAQGEE